jgi:DNA-directed RNA polymerase subunit F
MQKIDLDLLREKIGEFTLDKQKYSVYEPTLEQILTNYVRSQEVDQELSQLDDDDSEKLKKFWDWRQEQVRNYVPELSEEQVKKMNPKQLNAILDLVEGNTEEAEEKKTKKKKS